MEGVLRPILGAAAALRLMPGSIPAQADVALPAVLLPGFMPTAGGQRPAIRVTTDQAEAAATHWRGFLRALLRDPLAEPVPGAPVATRAVVAEPECEPEEDE